MKLDKLQCSLEAHEQRIKERETDRSSEHALLAQSGKRFNNGSGNSKGKAKQKHHKSKKTRDDGTDDSSVDESNHDDGVSPLRQKGSHNSGKSGNSRRKHIQCWYCKEWGHFATQCKVRKTQKVRDDQAQLTQESNSEDDQVLLMVTNDSDKAANNEWYLDTGCSNHMTRRKDWLIDLDE